MIHSADSWPEYRFKADDEFSVEFYPETEQPLDITLLVNGADRAQAKAAELGGLRPRNDLVCLSYRRHAEAQHVRISVILRPEKFFRLEETLHRYVQTDHLLSFGLIFYGFANQSFVEPTLPTVTEFFDRAPYIVHEELQFSLHAPRGPFA